MGQNFGSRYQPFRRTYGGRVAKHADPPTSGEPVTTRSYLLHVLSALRVDPVRSEGKHSCLST